MVWAVECTRMEALKAPTGVWSGEGAVPPPEKNFGMFSFEMAHFDALWSTFRPTIIATTMFMTSAEV